MGFLEQDAKDAEPQEWMSVGSLVAHLIPMNICTCKNIMESRVPSDSGNNDYYKTIIWQRCGKSSILLQSYGLDSGQAISQQISPSSNILSVTEEKCAYKNTQECSEKHNL